MNYSFTEINDKNNVASNDRGLHYGDGFFTTGLVKNGRLVFADYHLERLNQAADKLNFTDWKGPFVLSEVLSQLRDRSEDLLLLKIAITRGASQRGYAAIGTEQYSVLYSANPYQPSQKNTPIKLCISSYPVSKNKYLAGLKTLNRIDQVLAATEAHQLGFDNALMCYEKFVVCTTNANLFFVKEKDVVTPLLSEYGIEGICKKTVKSWCKELGYQVYEKPIFKSDLAHFEQAFTTNSVIGVTPIKNILSQEYLNFNLAEVLQSRFNQLVNSTV